MIRLSWTPGRCWSDVRRPRKQIMGGPQGGVRGVGGGGYRARVTSEVTDKVRTRYAELVAKINEAQHRYYVDDAPTLSDAEYDELMHELETMEAGVIPSWSRRLADAAGGRGHRLDFAAVHHAERMISLDNAFNDDELPRGPSGSSATRAGRCATCAS